MMDIIRPKWKETRHSFYLINRNLLTRASLIVLILLILTAIFAPVIIPYPDDISKTTDVANKFIAPCRAHLFGTDELGRDIFSRVLYGTRISVTAVLAVGLSLIGVPLGAIAGSIGGATDEIIMRITDIFLSFPPFLLAMH